MNPYIPILISKKTIFIKCNYSVFNSLGNSISLKIRMIFLYRTEYSNMIFK